MPQLRGNEPILGLNILPTQMQIGQVVLITDEALVEQRST